MARCSLANMDIKRREDKEREENNKKNKKRQNITIGKERKNTQQINK